MATGSEHVPLYPDIEGLDLFKGLFLHAQSYKDPAPFADQTVLVIGQGASTGDTCVVCIPSYSQRYKS
jgi:cation diffusion facilitator CzcD-associated flavoprotein CzcO